jgi:hypothetical protein
MPVNALAPDPRNAMLRPYEPTWKEQIAAFLMGNARPSPERRQFATGIADILGYLPGTGNVLQGQEAARAGDTKGAIMAMLPLPGANVATRAEQAIAQDVAKGIRAYHASPHDFPAFDITKIGRGEGNQSFGHGLYFAESPKVSGRGGHYDTYFQSKTGTPANIYEVNIKADPESLLDWDKPLSEQPHVLEKIDPRLRGQLENRLDRAGLSPNIEDYTGGEFHSMLTKHSNESDLAPGLQADPGQPEVAEYLQSIGVSGVRYFDKSSRTAGEGSRNYTVFDDKLVEIMRKYGLMGPIGAGIAAKILARQEQRQEM